MFGTLYNFLMLQLTSNFAVWDFALLGNDEQNSCAQRLQLHAEYSEYRWCFLWFGSDGVIRVFTASPDRMASPAILAEYEQLTAASEIPAQIGDIKTEDLVGPSALQVPGEYIFSTKWVH